MMTRLSRSISKIFSTDIFSRDTWWFWCLIAAYVVVSVNK